MGSVTPGRGTGWCQGLGSGEGWPGVRPELWEAGAMDSEGWAGAACYEPQEDHVATFMLSLCYGRGKSKIST